MERTAADIKVTGKCAKYDCEDEQRLEQACGPIETREAERIECEL